MRIREDHRRAAQRLKRKRRALLKRARARRARLQQGRVCYRRQPPARALKGRAASRSAGRVCLWKQALVSYQLAVRHQPTAAYRLARHVLACQPRLVSLVARTALVLAQEDVPLEGLDLLEALFSLGYAPPPLLRVYARILGRLGYHREALIALRKVWREPESGAI